METVFNYGITPQERLSLHICDREQYLSLTERNTAFKDVCNLLNLRGQGREVVNLFIHNKTLWRL